MNELYVCGKTRRVDTEGQQGRLDGPNIERWQFLFFVTVKYTSIEKHATKYTEFFPGNSSTSYQEKSTTSCNANKSLRWLFTMISVKKRDIVIMLSNKSQKNHLLSEIYARMFNYRSTSRYYFVEHMENLRKKD